MFVAARSAAKGADAAARLTEIPGDGVVQLIELDLATVESIHRANDAIRTHTDGLDGVINNAGIMQRPQLQTEDGFEMQFGTNHLGHFLLNQLTFDLVAARSGRIVSVSSIAHRSTPGINFDDPMFSSDYSPTKAYTQSKLANLMYGLELARRLEVLAVAGNEAKNGAYYGPTKFGDARGPVGESRISDAARDQEAAARLWTLSEDFLGITWNLT